MRLVKSLTKIQLLGRYYIPSAVFNTRAKYVDEMRKGEDMEYFRLKWLCFACSLLALSPYAVQAYNPEYMKKYKDEPWSPF